VQQQPAGPRATPHVWNGVAQGPAHDSARGEARGAVTRFVVHMLRVICFLCESLSNMLCLTPSGCKSDAER
jgi:hypothetical protein